MAAIRPIDLRSRIESDPSLIVFDVRETEDYRRSTIPGARNIPFDGHTATRIANTLEDRLRPVVFVCSWGHRSAVAAIGLRREGFANVSWLEGGLEAWGLAAQPVARGTPAPEVERPRFAD